MSTQTIIAPGEARAIATEAYIYGFPIVDNYRVLHSYFVNRANTEFKAPWNAIRHTARVYTPADTAIQTPNLDTSHSYLGADLRTEPLVLSVPAVDGRYYSLQFIDLYTHNFAYVGSRATGSGAGYFMLVGPNWYGKAPPGVKAVIRCETDFAFALYRTQLFNPGDVENVKAVQAGYTVQTLSQFLGAPPPPRAKVVDWMKPLTIDQERTSLEFFNVLNFVLQFCPTHPSEEGLRARLAHLGVSAGDYFSTHMLLPEIRLAIEVGIADAWRKYRGVENQLALGERTHADLFGSRGYLRDNFTHRMVGAVDGIYGSSKEEGIYPVYFIDADGHKLDASAHRYTLRFAPGQLPPVNAFWSLSMYQLPSRLLVANRLNRYLVNSPMVPGLKRDADGGVTLHVQHDSPGANREANWLPAPRGPFMMTLRMYWPRASAIDGEWSAPSLERVP